MIPPVRFSMGRCSSRNRPSASAARAALHRRGPAARTRAPATPAPASSTTRPNQVSPADTRTSTSIPPGGTECHSHVGAWSRGSTSKAQRPPDVESRARPPTSVIASAPATRSSTGGGYRFEPAATTKAETRAPGTAAPSAAATTRTRISAAFTSRIHGAPARVISSSLRIGARPSAVARTRIEATSKGPGISKAPSERGDDVSEAAGIDAAALLREARHDVDRRSRYRCPRFVDAHAAERPVHGLHVRCDRRRPRGRGASWRAAARARGAADQPAGAPSGRRSAAGPGASSAPASPDDRSACGLPHPPPNQSPCRGQGGEPEQQEREASTGPRHGEKGTRPRPVASRPVAEAVLEVRRSDQALRPRRGAEGHRSDRRARRRSTASSGPTAPARRRPSASSRGSCGRRRARCSRPRRRPPAGTGSRRRRGCARWSRCRPSTRGSPASRTSRSSRRSQAPGRTTSRACSSACA